MNRVDIAIPIYNAYEYTEECINSILKYTDLNKNGLILVNDKSPDERVLPMLEKIVNENKDKNIELINNEENLGFVGSVNIAMKKSKNDIILLNSDTEVTKNWLEKIVQCGYSNECIATVTPLTNNGTICSIPNFGVDNELPENMSLDEYSEMVEKISNSRYPELTTGNGFCMFIKRSVIDEIGYFDEKTFQKGYGEENDFCYRALDNGYINVLCDNTFVYHKGTQSFKVENMTETRAKLVEEHMKLLREKYPNYVPKTDFFIAQNPLRDIQENVSMNIILYNKKRILYLVNEWKEDMTMTGGTSLHIKDIISKNINNNIASFVLAPDENDLSIFKLYLYTDKISKLIFSFKTDINRYGQIVFTNNSYKEIINMLFDTFKFDILHVHHFLYHSFDTIYEAKKRNIYSIITLHDLYMSCPSINMVYENVFCENHPNRDCRACLRFRYGVNEDSDVLKSWRRKCKEVLSLFDKIIVPSKDTKAQYEKVYDLNIDVVEHGVDFVDVSNVKPKVEKDSFDIAFVGVMAVHKGSEILKSLITNNNNSKIKIHLFGKAEDEILTKNTLLYTYHGEYERKSLPRLLKENGIDLACFFSLWPETYSYTLSEAYMAGIPVLSFDLGAVGQRVKDDNLGWVIPSNTSSEKILEKIEEISKNKKEYDEKKNNYKNHKFKLLSEMQEYYLELYNSVQKEYEPISLYKMINYNNRMAAIEFQEYKALYSHVVNKYERIRATKLWGVAKNIKGFFKERKNKSEEK